MMTLQSETQHIKKQTPAVLGLSQSDIDIRYRFNIMDYIRLHLKSPIFCHSTSALLKSVAILLLLTIISFCVSVISLDAGFLTLHTAE